MFGSLARRQEPSRALRPINPDNAWSLRVTAAAGTKLAAPYSKGTVTEVPLLEKEFTYRNTSSSTRRRSIRLSPIVEYSRLLPPVGVGPVSQCPRWGTASQLPYWS